MVRVTLPDGSQLRSHPPRSPAFGGYSGRRTQFDHDAQRQRRLLKRNRRSVAPDHAWDAMFTPVLSTPAALPLRVVSKSSKRMSKSQAWEGQASSCDNARRSSEHAPVSNNAKPTVLPTAGLMDSEVGELLAASIASFDMRGCCIAFCVPLFSFAARTLQDEALNCRARSKN